MPIQPATISVTDPVSLAIERTKLILFRPFDLNRWFVIGFCSWLATLGQGGGFNFNYGTGRKTGTANFHEMFERTRDYVMHNLSWIVPLAIVLVGLCIVLGVMMLWVSSRGKFMFLHCVALNKAEIKVPWEQFEPEGNSLFKFRLVVALISLVTTLPVVAVMGIAVWQMVQHGAATVTGVVTTVVAGLVLVVLCIIWGVILSFTTDFVVPIMFSRRNRCLEAWREFRSLAGVNLGNFVIYLLFQIVIGIACGAIVLGAVLVTCCVAGCLMLIPYIGAVVLLPVRTFKRSYSIIYFAQYGPEYNVIPPLPPLA